MVHSEADIEQEEILDSCNVFVKYLPHHYGEEELHQLFAEFGNIRSVKVMVDPQTGSSLGYGYIIKYFLENVTLLLKTNLPVIDSLDSRKQKRHKLR